MTKAEIASEIAKATGIDKTAVVTVIEQFMTVVKDSLAHGENVYLRGFGSFVVKQLTSVLNINPIVSGAAVDGSSCASVLCASFIML